MTASYDLRVWLLWGAAMMLPALLVRNPIVLVELLVIGISTAESAGDRLAGWRWFLRVAIVLIAVGVLFNVLTVHSGDRTVFDLPSSWVIVGGRITLNAVAYGVVSGLALLLLVLTGVTLGSLIRWGDLARLLPRSLAPVAVVGSVAWAFLPRMGETLREIRDVNLVRGARIRGARDLAPLLVPLLASGLERAVTTAEALEARGFGVSTVAAPRSSRRPVLVLASLILLAVGAYGLATAASPVWFAALVAGLFLFAGVMRAFGLAAAPATRYRSAYLEWRDWLVLTLTMLALAGFAWRWVVAADRLRFDPYPAFVLPPVDLPAMLFLALLIVPIVLAAPPDGSRR